MGIGLELPYPYPEALLDAIVDVHFKQHVDSIAILDNKRPGTGFNCSCGMNFPPRIPENWLPPIWLQEDWDEASEEEREEAASFYRIKAETAVRDFQRHVAEQILIFLRDVG